MIKNLDLLLRRKGLLPMTELEELEEVLTQDYEPFSGNKEWYYNEE